MTNQPTSPTSPTTPTSLPTSQERAREQATLRAALEEDMRQGNGEIGAEWLLSQAYDRFDVLASYAARMAAGYARDGLAGSEQGRYWRRLSLLACDGCEQAIRVMTAIRQAGDVPVHLDGSK